MTDASQLAASQDLLDGRFAPEASLPQRGLMVVDRTCMAPAYRREVVAFPLAGKFKRMRVRFVPWAVARATARFDSELSIESCLVAMSTARGEGISRSEPHFWPIMAHQRGAIK